MAKKKHGDDGGGYSWMDTYGDMVTLLLAFFVMLFSMSSISEDKWEMLLKAFAARGAETTQIVIAPEGEGDQIADNQGSGSPDGETIDVETALPEDFDQLFEYLKAYIEQNNMESSVSVQKNGDNSVYIRFADNIFFDADSAVLLPDKSGILEFLGRCLINVDDQLRITRIDGHTADPKIENYSVSDRTLSTDRANSVLLYFEEIAGVNPSKLMSSGYGKNFPIADNDTAEGRKKNRRVEMMILSNSDSGMTTEELYAMIDPRVMTDIFDDKYSSEEIVIPQTSPDPTDSASAAQSTAPQDSSSAVQPTAPQDAASQSQQVQEDNPLPQEPPQVSSTGGQLIPPP